MKVNLGQCSEAQMISTEVHTLEMAIKIEQFSSHVYNTSRALCILESAIEDWNTGPKWSILYT